MQLIVSKKEALPAAIEPESVEILNDNYEIWTYDDRQLPPISVGAYSYSAIPKLLAPISTTALEKSGVFRLQREFVPGLTGNGVYVSIVDTGINFADAAFIDENGQSKIAVLWDQSNDRIYFRDEINSAIKSDNPYENIPGDEDGHGTFIASVICGNENRENDFTGIATKTQLIVIRLRPAERELREYFFAPENSVVFSEADVMRAAAFADRYAMETQSPMAMCVALGCNNGSHRGEDNLSDFLSTISTARARVVIAGTGNEANSRHHYLGATTLRPKSIEINVEQDMAGLYAECWVLAPDILTLTVTSPSGQSNPPGVPVTPEGGTYTFLLEGTTITIDYRQSGRNTRDLLIFIRFSRVVGGVWTIRFYPQSTINGVFHIWLPMTGLLPSNVSFIVPNPNTTLTMPSDATRIISVGGYSSLNDALFLESGRGYNSDGLVKPDFVAPAVDITGIDRRGGYVEESGTSLSAAITTGVSALVLEWMIVRGNLPTGNGVDIKNSFIRNCRRNADNSYPNEISGYGYLNGFANFRKNLYNEM